MAPKKPKQPTMLQRQRALRKQQQQTKQQASKQLPPKGGTSANTRQARGQRTSTAKAQAANQQRIIARGMEGFVRRGQAMDKLDKAAKGTQGSGTRTAGAGGGLARTAKPVSKTHRLPPSSQGATRIGNSSQPWGEQPIRKVNVKDLGPSNALKGGSTQPRQLPPAQQGPQAATRRQRAQAKADAAAKGSQGPNRVGQPAGAANRRYGANVVDAAVKRAQSSTRLGRNISVGRGGAAAMALGALNMIDDARLTPAQRAKKYEVVNPDRGQNMLTKLQSGTLGKPNNSVKRDPNGRSSRGVNTPQGRTVATGSQQYNDYRNRQIADNRARLQGVGNPAKPNPSAPRQQPPAAPTPAARPSASRPSQTSSSSPATTKPAARNIGPVADGDAFAREKDPKKFNPMMQKMFGYQTGDAPDQRAARNKTEGKGPVADGKAYAESLKINKKDKKRGRRRSDLTG